MRLIQVIQALLLAAYTGNVDVVFGITVSGRPPTLRGVETTVGLFINNLPVRVIVPSAETPLLPWLKALQERQIEMREHECCSLAQIASWSGLPAGQLFDSLLVFENYAVAGAVRGRLDELKLEVASTTIRTAYPITLVAAPLDTLVLRLVTHGSVPEDLAIGILPAMDRMLEECALDAGVTAARLLSLVPMKSSGLSGQQIEAARREYVAPRTMREFELVRFLESFFGVQPIGVRDNLLEIVHDSLTAIRLLGAFQQRFGTGLPVYALLDEPTIEHLQNLLASDGAGLQASPLVLLRPGAGQPFFCVHPSTGAALCYLNLARMLGTGRPFYGLQSLSLGRRNLPDLTIEQIAEEYVRSVQSLQPEGPYWLGGWSMGGDVAFEMARQLEARSQRVARVILFDTRPPGALGSGEVVLDEAAAQLAFAWAMCLYAARDSSPLLQDVPKNGTPWDWSVLTRLLGEMGTLPPGINDAEILSLYDLWKAHFRAAQLYRPAGPIRAPITFFRALEMPPPQLLELLPLELGADPGFDSWSRFSLAGVESLDVPGSHYTLFNQPHVAVLAETLQPCLCT